MAALAAANALATVVLIGLAVALPALRIAAIALAAACGVIAAGVGSASVTAAPTELRVRIGVRTKIIPRDRVAALGISTVRRSKFVTVAMTMPDGRNVGIGCLQRWPTARARSAIANQAVALLTCQVSNARGVPWSRDAIQDDLWRALARAAVAAQDADAQGFTDAVDAGRQLSAHDVVTRVRLRYYVIVTLLDLIARHIETPADHAKLASLSQQHRARYRRVVPDDSLLDDVLARVCGLPEPSGRAVGERLFEGGTAAIGCLLDGTPHLELERLRTKVSGWLLAHAPELPARTLITTRVFDADTD